MSTDLNSYLTFGLGLTKCPKITLHMLEFIHCSKVRCIVNSISADLYTIALSLKNYPKNDPSQAKIHPLVPKL